MKSFAAAALYALTGASAAFGVASASMVKAPTALPNTNSYIVEFDEGMGWREPGSLHRRLYESLKERDVPFVVDHEFDSRGYFVGAAVTLSDPRHVEKLARMPGVARISSDRNIPRPQPVSKFIVAEESYGVDGQSTHQMTGVDKLHAEGLLGEGIKVGIIDTGIDYNHPVLGKGFGTGYKVAGGYDFVGDNFDGSNTPQPDNDPLDTCAGHGTHVAGIIGANPGNPYNISGVAYKSSIYAYRVFGCSGGTLESLTIAALLKGVEDGMDVLTLSLGDTRGWTESAPAVVASRIAKSGKIVTIAAGNNGEYGAWYTSSPGSGIGVISVGSVDSVKRVFQTAKVVNATHGPIVYDRALPLNITGVHRVYATSFSTNVTDDACQALPDNTPDLKNYVVVVRRGTCLLTTKLDNVAAKGGRYVLLYNNVIGYPGLQFPSNYTAAFISAEDGAFLVRQVAKHISVGLTFPQTGAAVSLPYETGGLSSSFSSFGLTYDAYLKPSVSAPGGRILSTLPVAFGAYAEMSGTSMATPFLAGVAALLLKAKGASKEVGLGALSLFQNTAQPIFESKADGAPLHTLAQAGAGLVDAYAMIHTDTLVNPGQLELNDTANFQGMHTITVKNVGNESVTYTLGHEPAATVNTYNTSGAIVYPLPITQGAASVKFSTQSFTLGAGKSQCVTLHFTAPQIAGDAQPLYSGFVTVASGYGKVAARVSYMGTVGSLRERTVLDTSSQYFGIPIPALVDSQGELQTGPKNYTFVGDDVPTLYFRLLFGTPLVRFDLVTSNTKPNGTITSLGLLGFLDYLPRNTVGPTAATGGYDAVSLTKEFDNGTTITPGQYRVVLNALKVFGDETKNEDWERWTSPIVGVL